MVKTMLAHEVKNFAEWKKGFDADASNRAEMGINITGVYQSCDNPNEVVVFAEVPSMEAIHAFLENPDVAESMQKAGVMGQPEFMILNDVE
jgi:hypothetical protein